MFCNCYWGFNIPVRILACNNWRSSKFYSSYYELNYDLCGSYGLFMLQCGFSGFYSKNTVTLTPKVVSDIHKRGGTMLGTSRGGSDTLKIVDNIQDREINQVFLRVFIFVSLSLPLLSGVQFC